VSLTTTPLTDSAGNLVGAAEIVRDITEQERAEQALSSVSRRLIQAQEQERSRIARELHDDIGQRLTLLATELTELSAGAPGSIHGSQTARLQQQASEIAADIQTLSHELHSSRLELLGVATAMRSFCDEFADQQHIDVDFAAHDVLDELPPEVSLCLFRVLQEALRNSAKHSGVRHFEVQLWGAGDEINLVVGDPGDGFDLEAARAGRGLGLVSMAERMKLVDGDLSIETHRQRGTRIHARAPWRSGCSRPDGSSLSRPNG
jgi:signal transduction histidine kinase